MEQNANKTELARTSSTTNPGRKKITPKKQPGKGQSIDSFCEEIFRKYDKDRDGKLTIGEFRVMLKELIEEDLSEREVNEYRKSVANKDNNTI